MSRTGEMVLASISAVFTVIGIILLAIVVIGGNTAFQDAAFISEFEQEILSDPTFTSQDTEVITQFMEVFIDLFGLFGWGFITLLVISLVLNIIGIVSVNKNKKPKNAGILFIVAGLFAGVLSLTSILLYVAAIMCFVRKPPIQFAEQEEYYTAKETL